MKTIKHYLLEAKFGSKRVKRKFSDKRKANEAVKTLAEENPEWGKGDFLVLNEIRGTQEH